MGITSAWSITAHDDDVIASLVPRVQPLIERHRESPEAQRAWQAWCADPLPDHRGWRDLPSRSVRAEAVAAFLRLTSEIPLNELHCCDDCGFHLYDIWEASAEAVPPYVAVFTKDYALSALFHAIGPTRAAQLPGWCGDFLLTSDEVRRTLPAVEEALTFSLRDRVVVQERVWLDYHEDEEPVLDGPLRAWRQAASAGLGLFGANVHIY